VQVYEARNFGEYGEESKRNNDLKQTYFEKAMLKQKGNEMKIKQKLMTITGNCHNSS